MLAKMQDLDWDDLRIFAALVEAGSFAAAATRLGQHETTVARRLRRLEDRMGHVLWLGPEGGLTDAGQRLRDRALAMLDEVRLAQADLSAATGPVGLVRLTAVPWIVDLAVIPQLAAWQAAVPGVELEVRAAHGNLSLLHGEADIALRLGRPAEEADALTYKLCDVPFTPAGSAPDWIGYVADMSHLPQARWTDEEAQKLALRVSDQTSAIAAMQAGLGRAWVPVCAVGDAPLGARRESRPLWCVTHPRSRRAPAIRAVIDTLLPLVVSALRG